MLLYKILNPIVSTLLNSPLHGIMSGNTLIIHFKGRKSGRALSTPVSYTIDGDCVRCFTSKSSLWWKNVAGCDTVEVLLKGKRHGATPSIETEDAELIAEQLTRFLRRVPRDAKFSGVALDKSGEPNREDILKVAPDMVCVELHLSH